MKTTITNTISSSLWKKSGTFLAMVKATAGIHTEVPCGISHIINKYVKKAEKEGRLHVNFSITPHTFRHSKSMHMLHTGINLIYIRDFLGHVDSSTTEIYARADTEMKRQAIEASCEDIFPEENLQDWYERTDFMSFL